MKEIGTRFYEFGSFKLDAAQRSLWQDENLVSLTPKAVETLIVLVESRGQVVEKETILNQVWQDTFVEESTLAQNIFTLRKVLGRDEKGNQFIETVPRRGYRFAADVTENFNNDNYFIIGKQTTTRIIAEQEEIETSEEPNATEIIVQKSGAKPKSFLYNKYLYFGLTIAVVLIFTAIYFAIYNFSHDSTNNFAATRFQKIESRMLTNSGNIQRIGLSPDGKYLAYAARSNGKQSLFLRNLTSPNNLELTPPTDKQFRGITFSPDSTQIFYVMDETTKENLIVASLYQISVLGGVSKKILEDVDTPVAFSPDGKKIAFTRYEPNVGSHLIIANSDGTELKILKTQQRPRVFGTDGVAWSPDGKFIASPVREISPQKNSYQLAVFSAADGTEQNFPSQKWTWIGQISWMSDGSGLIFPAWDENSEIMSDQIWTISFPDGNARKITQEISGFYGLGLTEKADALATLRSEKISSWWTANENDFSAARKISNIVGDMFSEKLGAEFTPDGRVVFASRESGNSNIWMMDADGKNRRPLTNESSENYSPTVSPDGNYIVFVSHRSGKKNLWRMKIDGTEVHKLTDGNAEEDPNFSGDGKTIIYTSYVNEVPMLWKIPLQGGAPTQITNKFTKKSVVSPDGKFVACLYPESEKNRLKLTILSAADSSVVKQFDTPAQEFGASFHWSSDGKNIVFVKNENGVSNLWEQPIDGSAPKQLTNFNEDQIFRFAFSRAGNQIIYERGAVLDDVILIRDKTVSQNELSVSLR